MTAPSLRARASQLLLAAAVVVIVGLTGNDAGRLISEIRLVGAAIGACLVIAYLFRVGRDHDVVDRFTAAALLLFTATCVTSSALRPSFEAATDALAYTAAFFLARGLVADERAARMARVVLALLGVCVGISFAVIWGAVWLRWFAVTGVGAPPFNLVLPAPLFRHQYLVGLLAGLLLPATIAAARLPLVRPFGLVGAVATAIVAIQSGGRTVWLALAAALVAAALVSGGRGVAWPKPSVRVVAGVGLTALFVAVAVPAAARLGATSTIDLRLAVWSSSLSQWASSPVLGHGPGTFVQELTASGYFNVYEPAIPHAHNVVVQVLVEGGLLGVAALALLVTGIVIGIARHGRLEPGPAAAMALFAIASLTDNPTLDPFLVVPLIIWVALATPRQASVAQRSHPMRWILIPAAGIAGAATAATILASLAYDQARTASASGDGASVIAHLETATILDPAVALYHRNLGAWSLTDGNVERAAAEFQQAVDLNPADSQAKRGLALTLAAEGQYPAALEMARAAEASEETRIENALTVAYIAGLAGDRDDQHSALVRAVRFAPWITAAPEWDRAFPIANESSIFVDAAKSWEQDDRASYRNSRARTWLAAIVGTPIPADASLPDRLEGDILSCNLAAAQKLLDSSDARATLDVHGLQARVMLARARDQRASTTLLETLQIRGYAEGEVVLEQVRGASPVWNYARDTRAYNRRPIETFVEPELPTEDSGLSAWLGDPIGAAAAGSPQSPLAGCG